MLPKLTQRIAAWLGLVVVATASPAAETNAVPGSFLQIVNAQFATWDANRDGVLAVRELDALVADARITGRDAAAVAALKRASRGIKFQCPRLTLANIRDLATQAPATNRPNFLKMFGEGLSRLTNAPSRDLFSSGLPKLETIHQGKLGDCFCLAPLGAMVHCDPRQVAALFTRLGDGQYRVQLGKQTFQVPSPTDAELAMTASNERDGVWVNLYEKAVAKTRNGQRPPTMRSDLALDALARGGSAGTILAALTGHDIARFSFKFAKDRTVSTEHDAKLQELRLKLAEAVREKRLMTCGTTKTTTPGLNPNHAYALLGWDGESDAVTLWNPHGSSFKPKGKAGPENGYPREDGIFKMPLKDFVQQFSGMAFEVIQPPKSRANALLSPAAASWLNPRPADAP
jgi:hypothetical protein